jgi:hypothetical protein
MSLLCHHSPPQAIVGTYTLDQCRVCWKYLNDPKHKKIQDALTKPSEVEKLTTKIGNFTKALTKHTLNFLATVDSMEYDRRVAICERCEFYKEGKCTKCGCRIQGRIISKARWASEKCPVGKW